MPEKRISAALARKIKEYIDDPNTRVYVDHNFDTGEWLFSVCVYDSGGFWLDSFKTGKGATKFIQRHHLKTIED